jgi:transposase
MDRQTLRDWIHRFNASGPEGLFDNWTKGPKPRLSEEHLAQFAKIVEVGPDREIDGVVRWRRIDLKRVIAERFGVDFHPRYVGKLLKKLGFSHISARPRHPMQDERIVEAFKKRMARPVCKGFFERADDQSAATYPASEDSSQPRWRYARSGPHKLHGVERRFLNQAFGAPFDCQAISISPLANLIDRSAHFSALRLCPDQRLRRQGQSPDDEPFAAP